MKTHQFFYSPCYTTHHSCWNKVFLLAQSAERPWVSGGLGWWGNFLDLFLHDLNQCDCGFSQEHNGLQKTRGFMLYQTDRLFFYSLQCQDFMTSNLNRHTDVIWLIHEFLPEMEQQWWSWTLLPMRTRGKWRESRCSPHSSLKPSSKPAKHHQSSYFFFFLFKSLPSFWIRLGCSLPSRC